MRVAVLPEEVGFGGVARVTQELRARLPSFGIEIVEADVADIVHCHAIAASPQVDVYTCHGVYPPPVRSDWEREANNTIYWNLLTATTVTSPCRWGVGSYRRRDVRIIPNGTDLFARVEPQGYVFFGKVCGGGVVDEGARLALWVAEQTPDIPYVFVSVPDGVAIPPNVRVTGKLSREDALAWLGGAACLLATTLECFSIQVLEAMSMAVSVVSMAYGGTQEVFEHGVPGVLCDRQVDLPEAVRQAIANRGRLGEAGREIVAAHYTWDRVIRQYISCYEDSRRVVHKGPEASIVITCYNKEQYIGDAIESALRQTVPAEVIVVDDRSTDGSWGIISKGRVKAIRTRRNTGSAAKARNLGVQKARGRFVVCLDGDDVLSVNYLEKMLPHMAPGVGFAYSNFAIIGTSNGVRSQEYNARKLQAGNYVGCASLFRREAWERAGGYKDINPSWEDYEFWLSIAEAGYTGKWVDEYLWGYRMNDTGRNAESQSQVARLRAVVNAYHPRVYKPTVSIIIPCYAHEQYLAQAVDSVIGQTFQDWECIVVNDGSPGDTRKALRAYEDEPRVRYISQRNKGLPAARNAGVSRARGTYILPLDADDAIAPTFLERTLAAQNGRNIVYTDFVAFRDDGSKTTHVQPEYSFEAMLQRGMMFATSLYPRCMWEEIGGYPEDFTLGWEDYAFWIMAGTRGWYGVKVAEPLFWYRQRDGSMREQADSRREQIKAQLWDKFRPVYEFYRQEAAGTI